MEQAVNYKTDDGAMLYKTEQDVNASTSDIPVPTSSVHNSASNLSIGQIFSTSTSLPMIDTRSGEITQQSVKESYRCPQCSFVTAWKSSLSIHLKTHTNERPWQCAVCNKHFKLKHHLKHHIFTHSSSKPFKCNLCNYKTADSRNIQRHKYNKHRTTLKRRGAEKLSLPTMVPGSHANFDAAINAFVETGQNFTQTASNTPLSTPSFQVPLSSPVFQSPTSLNVLGNNQLQWTQRSPDNFSQQASALLMQRLTEAPQNNVQTGADLYQNTSLQEKAMETLGMTSPENLAILKEELCSARAKRKSLTSERSFDLSQPGKATTSPTSSTISADISITNISSKSQRNFITVDTEDESEATPQTIHFQQPFTKSSKDTTSKETELKWKCCHCKIVFPDNIMYGLHMGCHSVSKVFQCNICGVVCSDKHDFMFHFTIGKHQT